MADTHVLITLPFPAEQLERLRAVSPKLQFHVHPARKAEELPEELLPQIEVLYTIDTLPAAEEARRLKWIQLHYAGLDHVIQDLGRYPEVAVTTLSGAAVAQISEAALLHCLALGHKLPRMFEDKAARTWADDRFQRFSPQVMRNSTVGIVGYGSAGREIARLAHALGAHVLAMKRDLKQLKDEDYKIKGLGDPAADIPKRIYPPAALASMLSQCDFVLICVPLTQKTRGMISSKAFEAMKPTAYLIDVSRGGVVDHGALVSALNQGKLAGAALDVFPIEPLPVSSPLWQMPNVIISPHIAGGSADYYAKAAELFAANLRLYLEGKPLMNRYQSKRGY